MPSVVMLIYTHLLYKISCDDRHSYTLKSTLAMAILLALYLVTLTSNFSCIVVLNNMVKKANYNYFDRNQNCNMIQ